MSVPAFRSLLAAASAVVLATPAGAIAAPSIVAPVVVAEPASSVAVLDDAARERRARRAARTAKSKKAAKSAKAARSAKAAKAARSARAARSSKAAKRARATSARRAGARHAAKARGATARGARTASARARRAERPAAIVDAPLASLTPPEAPITLRGSPVAVEQAYVIARARGLAFTTTRRDALREADEGNLVRLGGSRHVKLAGVSLPYVRPATARFVASFGARYHGACGEPVTVTSAVRPRSVRLVNSVERSVHPTGMAVDLRVPRGGCRGWMRDELLALEEQGVVQATEERHPAHFHVVVLRAP